MRKFWYIATPYSKFPGGLDRAFEAAARARARLLVAGIASFSPIVHSHPVAMIAGIDPLDHSIWLPDDEPMMGAAFGLIVFMLQGWEDSFGIAEEIKKFKSDKKPIVYWEPLLPAFDLKRSLELWENKVAVPA